MASLKLATKGLCYDYLEEGSFVSRIVIGAKTLAAVSPGMYEGHLILRE